MLRRRRTIASEVARRGIWTEVLMKWPALWDVAPCRLLHGWGYFGGASGCLSVPRDRCLWTTPVE